MVLFCVGEDGAEADSAAQQQQQQRQQNTVQDGGMDGRKSGAGHRVADLWDGW